MSKPLEGRQHGKGRIKPAGTDEERAARFADAAAAKGKHAARTRAMSDDRDGAPTARVERLAERGARVKRSG